MEKVSHWHSRSAAQLRSQFRWRNPHMRNSFLADVTTASMSTAGTAPAGIGVAIDGVVASAGVVRKVGTAGVVVAPLRAGWRRAPGLATWGRHPDGLLAATGQGDRVHNTEAMCPAVRLQTICRAADHNEEVANDGGLLTCDAGLAGGKTRRIECLL